MKSYTNVINAAGLEAWKAANLNKATEDAAARILLALDIFDTCKYLNK